MDDGSYIIDQRRRESAATSHLLELMPISERLLEPLGLSRFCWAILELQIQRLKPDVIGEIDILAGPLQWTDSDAFGRELCEQTSRWPNAHPTIPEFFAAKITAEQGGIRWPPSIEHLVGIEVKCAYNEQGTIKSDKTSPEKIKGLRKQLARDLQLGLDRVALVDIIAHHPTDGEDGLAWLAAGAHAQTSITAMAAALTGRLANPLPDGRFTPEPSLLSVGHFVWSIGSVAGGNETMRGAGAPILLRQAEANAPGERTDLKRRIHCLLAANPAPRCWPILLKDCTLCQQLHALNESCASY